MAPERELITYTPKGRSMTPKTSCGKTRARGGAGRTGARSGERDSEICHHPLTCKAGLPCALLSQWGVGGTSKWKDLCEVHAPNFSLENDFLVAVMGTAWQMKQPPSPAKRHACSRTAQMLPRRCSRREERFICQTSEPFTCLENIFQRIDTGSF